MGNIDQGLQHSPPMSSPGPGGLAPNMKPPGMGVPPLFQVPFGTTPIAPGGVGAPNAMPPLPGAGAGAIPPKIDMTPEKKDAEVATPGAPALPPLPPLPAPPSLRPEEAKPAAPPVGIPLTKETPANRSIPNTPIMPASNVKGNTSAVEISPITLPPVGPMEIAPTSRPDLPLIPMIAPKN